MKVQNIACAAADWSCDALVRSSDARRPRGFDGGEVQLPDSSIWALMRHVAYPRSFEVLNAPFCVLAVSCY
jgi:hypothetical protein